MKLKDTEIEKIKNWIRTLQKSLTLETEAEFINILGKEKYFNEFLCDSLKDILNFKLSQEYINYLKKFCLTYQEYNHLDRYERKRVVIDTRKTLFKLEILFKESYKNSLKYFSFPKILINSASVSKVKDF